MSDAVQEIVRTEALSLRFGGVVALEDISISVTSGHIVGLVGPNGAGKTTLLNAIHGVVPPTIGRIFLEGRDVTHIPLHKCVALGIGRTFQGVELFPDLTVKENLLVGRHHLMRTGLFTGGLFFGPAKRDEIANRNKVEEIIEFFEIERYRDKSIGSLSYGTQKIVGVARAMCSEPRLLLLDEVASGLNREEKEDLARFILRLSHTQTITIIWVEHDIRLVSELSDQMIVLDQGRLLASGDPSRVMSDSRVQEAYIGPARSDPASNPPG